MELVKRCKVLALVTPDKEAEALAAGADYSSLTITFKIKDGWTDVDVIIDACCYG
jgi:large subunit ribosomal protein L1